MANPAPIEEQATLYVLDELNAADRHAFEVCLAESAELRLLVRELEEGAIAVAAASPHNPAPKTVWKRIEESVTEEEKERKVISFFSVIWRNGWAAAAACLIGWIFYAFSLDRPVNKGSEKPSLTYVEPNRANASVNNSLTTMTNPTAPREVEREREVVILRNQLVGLQRQVAQLSQSVTQQQALLNESSRLKFMQLVPVGSAGISTAPRSLSPALQRALFLGMARELGWLPSTNETSGPRSPEMFFGPGSSNQFNVDFVDFRPGKSGSDSVKLQNEPQTPPTETKTVASFQPPSPAVIFTSGENLVLALDSTVAPAGSELTFTTGSGELLGRTLLGENPVVVTTFAPASSTSGSQILITATPPNGPSFNLQLEAVTAP